MDFICFYFEYNEKAMLSFVDKHWQRIWTVSYIADPDPGHPYGWRVCVLKNKINNNNNN